MSPTSKDPIAAHLRLSRHAIERAGQDESLLDAARKRHQQLQPSSADEYGKRYLLDFSLTTPTGSATIRSAWIVLAGQNVLRLTSCYVL